jgi:outer membrane immunogenic protein
VVGLVLTAASPAMAQGYGNAPAGAYNWSGWYLGANAGWGWRSENPYPSQDYYSGLGVVGYGTGTPGLGKHDGFTAGATLGYQYQFGALVLGVDYDVQYAGIASNPRHVTTSFAAPTGTGGGTVIINGIPYTTSGGSYQLYTAGNYDPTDGDSNRWIGLARLRAGVAMNRWLLFATGGLAYRFSYETQDPYVVQPNGSVITYSGYNKADAWGWVIGGGAEYGFSDWITAKIEYLHMDFGAATYIDPIATTAVGSPVLYKYEREVDMVRAGISFRFNFGAPQY